MSQSPKRVVFVLPALNAGGAERVLITLMNGLDNEKFEKHFISVQGDGALRNLIDPAVPFYSLDGGSHMSLSIPKLYKQLKALKPEIVVSTLAHMNFALLLLSPLFPKTRFIVREAITPSFFLRKDGIVPKFVPILYRLLYPRAEMVIAPAQMILDEFKNLLKLKMTNHVLLPNPVDMATIRAQEKESVKVTKERKSCVHFICSGRLHPQKGFDRLIERLPDLDKEMNWQLTILGEGREHEALEKLINEKGLSGRVKLLGHISNPWPHIAKADVFLLPSRWEGLPNAVLESLACGTPVIATSESGGIREIAEHVPPQSLMVLGNMDEFILAMNFITPKPSSSFRPSLLSDFYYKDKVIERFSKLLENGSTSGSA